MVEDFFVHECVILEKVSAQNSVGGDEGSWSEVADSNYFGYIGRPGKDERMSGGIETVFATHKHNYPVNVSLTKSNRIKCVNGSFADQIFEVLPIGNIWGKYNKANLRLVA